MSTQCCPVKSLCIDPANPIQNFSAEAPDVELFIGFNTGWDNSDGGYNTPSIGGTWDSSGCQFICTSTVSQADADQCAANQQLACADGSWQRPPGTPQQNFLNDAENCASLCPDGAPFNFTVPAGTILATSRARADQIASSFACNNARQRRICLSSLSAPEACISATYSGSIVASGGLLSPTSNRWTVVSGSLPDGVNLSPFGGFNQTITSGTSITLRGTPTKEGNFNFTIRVTAPNGDFMQKQYSICVIDITPSSLPDATIGTAYAGQLSATSCANQQQSFQVTTGALPPGLVINEQTGAITGTPTGPAGLVTFTVTFQDFAS